jgi:hypothetical protein
MTIARVRYPLLALGIAALFCAVWASLLRFGWGLPSGRANLIELRSRSATPTLEPSSGA